MLGKVSFRWFASFSESMELNRVSEPEIGLVKKDTDDVNYRLKGLLKNIHHIIS